MKVLVITGLALVVNVALLSLAAGRRGLALVIGVDSSTQSVKVEVRDAETGHLWGRGRQPHPPTSPPRSRSRRSGRSPRRRSRPSARIRSRR